MITKNNTVLVTGADGFIGSHLVEMLHSKGFVIKALAQYNSFNSWGWLEDISCKDDIEIMEKYSKKISKGIYYEQNYIYFCIFIMV